MRDRESYVRYNPNDYEAVFVSVGEKVHTEINGGRVRCILTMDSPEDFDRAERVLAAMREIHQINQPDYKRTIVASVEGI